MPRHANAPLQNMIERERSPLNISVQEHGVLQTYGLVSELFRDVERLLSLASYGATSDGAGACLDMLLQTSSVCLHSILNASRTRCVAL